MPRTREQHYPSKLIHYSYCKKIIRRCMEKFSLLTEFAKCTLNIALKLTFSVFLFFFVFWLHFRPPRHCLKPFFERQFFTQMTEKRREEFSSLYCHLTLFKTKIAHFATLFKTGDTCFWPWFVLFCIQNYWYCKCRPLIASLHTLWKASIPKRHPVKDS